MATEEKLAELPNVISKLQNKCKTLSSLPFRDFKDYINKEKTGIGKLKEHPMIRDLMYAGVYCIYNEKKEIIYVGSAGLSHTLRYRIGDLFFYDENSKRSPFHHTLTYKLKKEFGDIGKVRDYYFENCRFKIIIADSDAEAHALEQLLILLFGPKYNNEIPNQ
ncbi:MAG: hypothetical protein RXR31_07065 [Thermoproteota archaeon]